MTSINRLYQKNLIQRYLLVLVFTLHVMVFTLHVMVFTLHVMVFTLHVMVFTLHVMVFTLHVINHSKKTNTLLLGAVVCNAPSDFANTLAIEPLICLKITRMKTMFSEENYATIPNPLIGSGDRVQTRLIFTVFIVWWPWKLGQGHQNLINSFNYPNDIIHKVWPESIIGSKDRVQTWGFDMKIVNKMQMWCHMKNGILHSCCFIEFIKLVENRLWDKTLQLIFSPTDLIQ